MCVDPTVVHALEHHANGREHWNRSCHISPSNTKA